MEDQVDDDSELPSALPGTIIHGKYRVDALIGRGGMGSVWSALHLGLNQRVAIKLISRRYAASREARQRFDVEAKAVAQLRSRFVVQVYDNGETPEGTPYLVMEMLEGESLEARVQKAGRLTLDETLRIIGQVGRALTRAHALGIVHRDLKPDNIFLTRADDEDGEIAKVLDFGIAKIKASGPEGSATRTGTVLGTPLFMSPEQARGLRSVDHRTDIYSLGMVAFTILTGQTAFSGESFGDILVAICTQPLPPLAKLAPWLPPGVGAWFERACAREPEARFASIEDMVGGFYAAAGLAPPNMRPRENKRAPSSGMDRVEKTALAGAGAVPGANSTPEQPAPTMSAISVTGSQLPTRSMLIPAMLGALAVLIIGIAIVFVVLARRQVSRAPAGGEPALAAASPTVLEPERADAAVSAASSAASTEMAASSPPQHKPTADPVASARGANSSAPSPAPPVTARAAAKPVVASESKAATQAAKSVPAVLPGPVGLPKSKPAPDLGF